MTPATAATGRNTDEIASDKNNPFNYQMEELSNSMLSVPLVKDASYILPPMGDSDDWGYVDPITQRPDRAHSPTARVQSSRKGH